MDPHSDHPDDLSELERRLSAWQPTAEGLHPDAMLFAAGRATARSGPARLFWPALTACMTLLAIALGIGLFTERHERLALAQQLRQHSPTTVSIPSPPSSPVVIPAEALTADELSPNGYLASHRMLEKGLDDWPVRALLHVETPISPSPNPPVLQVGQRDSLLDR